MWWNDACSNGTLFNLEYHVCFSGCWNPLVAEVATFSARRRKRRAPVAWRITTSRSWARRCSAIHRIAIATATATKRRATSPVMIHTNVCLALPMPHPPPQTRKITCAAISPSAGIRRLRHRCRWPPRRRPRRAPPARTRSRAFSTATLPVMATTWPTMSQVRQFITFHASASLWIQENDKNIPTLSYGQVNSAVRCEREKRG